MKKLTTLFFILFFTTSAFAGDCDPVDLDSPDGILYSIPRAEASIHTLAHHAYRKKYNLENPDQSKKITNLTVTPHSISLKNATREQALMMKNIISEFNVYGNQTLPIGIEFCSTALSKGPQFILKAISTLEERIQDCSAQSTIVSGRRMNTTTKKCEFRIRNASGSCSKIVSSYVCNKDNGDTWVPQDILERYLMTVSIIK